MNRRPEYDTDEFKALWFSRATLREMAERYGVSIVAIHIAARRRGFPNKFAVRTEQ